VSIQQQIQSYLDGLLSEKRADITALQQIISDLLPNAPISFHSGHDKTGKQVSNPSIGYGSYHHNYANGSSGEMYQIGVSANSTGLSLYLFGLSKKINLKEVFTPNIGKAQITSYCIKFKRLSDINKTALIEGLRTLYATADSN
jgi:hypothetical protein